MLALPVFNQNWDSHYSQNFLSCILKTLKTLHIKLVLC